jgi:hypothetical protein
MGFADPGRRGFPELTSFPLFLEPLDIVVEHVVFGDDGVDDKVNDDRPFPFLCGIEVLKAGMVFGA